MKSAFLQTALLLILAGIVFYCWPRKALVTNRTIDKIEVVKHKRILRLLSQGEVLKTYSIALGREPTGKKQLEGDKKTPEGVYYINDKNPNSGYYLNLSISYPNDDDEKNAMKLNQSPGGSIKIHGLKNGFGYLGRFHLLFDWTLGCIALTNEEIKELYENVPIGTEIEILE